MVSTRLSPPRIESVITSSVQLGQLLKGYRMHHHLTQEELGKRLGLTQAAISHFESDARRLHVHRLLTLLSLFDLELTVREKASGETIPASELEW